MASCFHPTSAKRNFWYRMASLSPLPSGAATLCLRPHGETSGFDVDFVLAVFRTGSELHVVTSRKDPPFGHVETAMTTTQLKLLKYWISPNPLVVAEKSLSTRNNVEWKNAKVCKSHFPTPQLLPRYTYIVGSKSVVCDKDIDVSIPGERSVDHPWCKASSYRRMHQTLDR